MAKVNYDDFNSFDMNECCDHFNCESQAQWKKIGKFIVADGQEYLHVMETEFDFYDTTSNEIEAFDKGVQYAMTKLNLAFEAAGLELEIKTADLVEAMGYVLTRVDDDPESFVKRVLKKPVQIVEGWV